MKINIVTAFNWACNIADIEKLKATEQTALFHVLKLLNRNFWRPVKLTPYILMKHTGCDSRTVKGALKTLFEKNILIHITEEEVYINIDDADKLKKRFGKNNADKPKASKPISEPEPDTKSKSEPEPAKIRTLQDAINEQNAI